MPRQSTVENEVLTDKATSALVEIMDKCAESKHPPGVASYCEICQASRLCLRIYNGISDNISKIRLTHKQLVERSGHHLTDHCQLCDPYQQQLVPIYRVQQHRVCESCALKLRAFYQLKKAAKRKRNNSAYPIFVASISNVVLGSLN